MEEQIKVQWFVGFTDAPFWWRKLFRKGFSHCYAITEFAETEGYLAVDPVMSHLQLYWGDRKKGTVFDTLARLKAEGHTLLYFAHTIDQKKCIRYSFEFSHCVSTIKEVLGFHSMAQTPYQLYRALIRAGATEL